MKIFIEKLMAPHDPSVYESAGEAPGVGGWNAFDADTVARYEEAGFLLVGDAVPRELVEAAVRELQGMREADDQAVERIAGAPVRLFQDMAMIKPPGGREKPWHQDHAYFNLPLDTRVVAAWVALSDATIENGCMHVIPGGHREGPRVHFMRRDWQICDADVVWEHRLAVPMTVGDIMLFDGKLPHGTPTNRTDQQRWALQFHYIPRDAREVDEARRLDSFGSEGKDITC